jgi:hypothetical protein
MTNQAIVPADIQALDGGSGGGCPGVVFGIRGAAYVEE